MKKKIQVERRFTYDLQREKAFYVSWSAMDLHY